MKRTTQLEILYVRRKLFKTAKTDETYENEIEREQEDCHNRN